MNIKSLTVAAVVLLGSIGAFGDTVTDHAVGDLTTRTTDYGGYAWSPSYAKNTIFTDNYTFSISGGTNSFSSLSVKTSSIPTQQFVSGSFTGDLYLTSNLLTPIYALTYAPPSIANGQTQQLYLITALDEGDYTLTIHGRTPTDYAGLYTAQLTSSVVAVPEPETYAMLLAGLGLMGSIVRRRNKADSA